MLARGPEPWMPMPRPAPRAGSPCASGVWNPSVENRGAQGGCWGHLKTADSVDGIKGQTRARGGQHHGWAVPAWLGDLRALAPLSPGECLAPAAGREWPPTSQRDLLLLPAPQGARSAPFLALTW